MGYGNRHRPVPISEGSWHYALIAHGREFRVGFHVQYLSCVSHLYLV